MRRLVLTAPVLTTVALLLATSAALGGDWEDELAITQDPVWQYRSYITTAPDDTVYVGWPDWTDWEDTKIMLMRSSDHGHTWTGPWITFEGLSFDNMDICADADALHLLLVKFYEDEEAEYKWLFYAKSVDGGETFSDPIQVGERQNIEAIKLFTSPGYIFIYAQNMDWETEEPYNYLYVSDDGGVSWVEKPLLPDETVEHPSFAIHGGTVHMAFGRYDAAPRIRYCQSTDAGDTWTLPVGVSHAAGPHSQLAQIAADENAIHVAWEDDRSGYFNVMYSRSIDGGETWSANVQLNDTFYGARVKLLADEEGLHTVWCQYHGDDGWPSSWSSADYGIIWYKFSGDSGATWSDEFRVSQNEYIDPIDLPDLGANYVKLAEYGAGFCAMWQDKRDGNVDLYLRNSLGPACPGDVDGDGDTDLSDLAALLAAYNTSAGDPAYNPAADFDSDGDVDLSDLAFLLSDYGCAP
jgi:hypothetical protein